jgi:hypothetical protein
MKRTVFYSALGLAVSLCSAHATGYIYFSSYAADDGLGAITAPFGASFNNNINQPINQVGIGIPYQAELYYYIGALSDPVDENSVVSVMSLPSAAMTHLSGVTIAYDNTATDYGSWGLGYFDDPAIVAIPGYTSGPITFELVAFNGSDYQDSISRGRSGSFTMNSIPNSPAIPVPALGDGGQYLSNFYVAPEPNSISMMAIGGIASLLAMRRKRIV